MAGRTSEEQEEFERRIREERQRKTRQQVIENSKTKKTKGGCGCSRRK